MGENLQEDGKNGEMILWYIIMGKTKTFLALFFMIINIHKLQIEPDKISRYCTISLRIMLSIKEIPGLCQIRKPFQFKSTLNKTSFRTKLAKSFYIVSSDIFVVGPIVG